MSRLMFIETGYSSLLRVVKIALTKGQGSVLGVFVKAAKWNCGGTQLESAMCKRLSGSKFIGCGTLVCSSCLLGLLVHRVRWLKFVRHKSW